MKYSIVNFKTLLEVDMRMEGEYYAIQSLVQENYIYGKDIIETVQYGTSERLNEEGKGNPILRLNEFESYFSGTPSKHCNSLSAYQFESLRLNKDDVLIGRTNGNPHLVGKSAIVPKDTNVAFASYLYRIVPNEDIINSATLMIYLNSRIGRVEIEKNLMISNQANFSPAKFRDIRIPNFQKSLQILVKKIVDKAYVYLDSSKNEYNEAEDILLKELDFRGWTPRNELSNIMSFKDVELAERFDSQYFQKRDTEIEKRIGAYRHGFANLVDIVQIKSRNFYPKEDQIYKYLELSNIDNFGNITGFNENAGSDLPTRARRKIVKGDIILSSIEGSLQSIALNTMSDDNLICSNGFFVLNSSVIYSEVLLILFKTWHYQQLLKKGCKGTILAANSKDELSKIPIPLVGQKVQDDIRKIVQSMYKNVYRSKRLLIIAKEGVEMAIARNEEKAILWMNNELDQHQEHE